MRFCEFFTRSGIWLSIVQSSLNLRLSRLSTLSSPLLILRSFAAEASSASPLIDEKPLPSVTDVVSGLILVADKASLITGTASVSLLTTALRFKDFDILTNSPRFFFETA